MPAPGSPLHTRTVEGVTVVWFRDRILLDTEELKIIEADLTRIASSADFRMVIDFENVQALSSQMLGALLKVVELAQRHRGRLGLCNLNSKIEEAFEITNLKKMFKIFDSRAAAVKGVL